MGIFLPWGMLKNPDTMIEEIYRSDWGRIVASLIRLVNDFDIAEEAAQEAFAAALTQWRAAGVPDSPQAWIFQTARHKAIDRVRRRARFSEKLEAYASSASSVVTEEPELDTNHIPDDRLRLIFTCCHPAWPPRPRWRLTLRTLGGLETDEIARAISYRQPRWPSAWCVPAQDPRCGYPVLRARHPRHARAFDAVLTVIYLIFNEGYAATRGESLVRMDLCGEAIRLGRLVQTLMSPGPPAEATRCSP